MERLFADPLPLPATVFRPVDRRTGVLDSIAATNHAWYSLLQARRCALLYSPSMPIECALWIAPGREKGVVQALSKLHIKMAGDLFADGTVKISEQITMEGGEVPLLYRFQ